MLEELNLYLSKDGLIYEIYKGFLHSWILTIPLDLSYFKKNTCTEQEIDLKDINLDLSDNISLNYLPKDLVYFIFNNNLISFENSSLNKTIQEQAIKKEDGGKQSLKLIGNSFQNEGKNNIDGFLKGNLIKVKNEISKKEEEKEEDRSKKCLILKDIKNNINTSYGDKNNGYPLSQIQNYNINIYNPYINYVNICCPSSNSPLPCLSNKDNFNNNNYKDSIFHLNENEVITGKLPVNVFCENRKEVNNLIGNKFFNKNDKYNLNYFVNNSINWGEGNPPNFTQKKLDQNIIFNYNNNTINDVMNMINDNEKSMNNDNKNGNQKMKKNKKKKKKKIDDEYTIEMFGRRGWICQGCNNFNYESRKNCNRCKIPKNPLKKSVIMDNKGNKITENLINANHKDDWNCYNCGNINYAFRLNCNRCQMKREDSYNEFNYNNAKVEN